jgi:DNA primase
MKFSPEFIEKVQESNNLLDIISQYTQLKPVGSGYMGRCPFPDHPEKTPSFSVSEVKQVFHCFGCQRKGNLFSFLRLYNGMSFPDAVEFLAQRAGIPLPVTENVNSQDEALQQKRKMVLAANEIAQKFFSETLNALPLSHPVREYLLKRGLKPQTVSLFKIGYAPPEWEGLLTYAHQKGVSGVELEDAKLVRSRKEGRSGYYDLFRDRLIFPIFNSLDQVLGFGGRILAQGEPKYLNSPETLAFQKSRVLFGLNQSAKHIRAQDQVVIVEGYMDMVSLFQAGVTNCVATMGTALTESHARILGKLTKNIVLLFDGDSAGQAAAERSLPILLGQGLFVAGLILPNNDDPDDFVQKRGGQALKALIASAPDMLNILLDKWVGSDPLEPSQKLRIFSDTQEILKSIQDVNLLNLYIVEVAKKLQVDQNWVRSQLASPRPVQSSKLQLGSSNKNPQANAPLSLPSDQGETEKVSLKGLSTLEATLLPLVIGHVQVFEKYWEWGLHEEIQHPGFKKIAHKANTLYRQHPEKFDKLASLLMTFVDSPEALLKAPLTKPVKVEALVKEVDENASRLEGVEDDQSIQRVLQLFHDCAKKLKEKSLQKKLGKLANELKQAPTPEKWQEFLSLKKSSKREVEG